MRARSARSLSDLREAGERQVVRVLDDGDDESPVERDGDADVVLLAIDDVDAGDGRVEHGELLQRRRRRRLMMNGRIGELLAGLRLELRARFLLPDPRDAREVDLEERGDVRGGVARRDHVLARERADLRHRLDAVAGPRLRARGRAARRRVARASRARRGAACAPGRDVVLDVLLRDAARDAGALHRGELDAVLGGDLSDERRGLRAEALLEAVAAGCGDGGRRGDWMGRSGGRWWQLVLWGGPPLPRWPRRRAVSSRRAPAPLPALRSPRPSPSRSAPPPSAPRPSGPPSTMISASTPAVGAGNLGVHLVGADLEDRLVALHRVADLLQPLRQRPLGDRFAHLGHDDVNACHVRILSLGVSGCGARPPHPPQHDRSEAGPLRCRAPHVQ